MQTVFQSATSAALHLLPYVLPNVADAALSPLQIITTSVEEAEKSMPVVLRAGSSTDTWR